jgi:predicted MFS family arabinose efflux permease
MTFFIPWLAGLAMGVFLGYVLGWRRAIIAILRILYDAAERNEAEK